MGRGSLTAPKAPRLEGMTTPGERLAARKADSYSSSTAVQHDGGGHAHALGGALHVEAERGLFDVEGQRLAQAEAHRGIGLLAALRQGIEIEQGYAHRRIGQHGDDFLAASADGGEGLGNGIA